MNLKGTYTDTHAFINFKEHEIVPACAEAEGTLDVFFLDFTGMMIGDACDNNPALVRSRVAAEVYERLSSGLAARTASSVALRRVWQHAALEFGPSASVCGA